MLDLIRCCKPHWLITALGAGTVFLRRQVPFVLLDALLGFAAGVMIAASFWSLLAPALEMAERGPLPSWLPATAGFLLGAGFLRVADYLLPHLHPLMPMETAEGVKQHWQRTTLPVMAITLHKHP